MNIDEINGLLQQEDNDDILFDSTEDEDFWAVFIQHGALSNGYMNVWLENQGGKMWRSNVCIISLLWVLRKLEAVSWLHKLIHT